MTFVNITTANITFNIAPTFPPAADAVEGRIRTATLAEIAARTGNGAVISSRLPIPEVRYVKSSSVSGSANTIRLANSPAITGYAEGMTFVFVAASTSTGDVRINVDMNGAMDLYLAGERASAEDIQAGTLYGVSYDGANFNIIGATRQSDAFNIATIVNELTTLAGVDRFLVRDISDSEDKFITRDNLRSALNVPNAFSFGLITSSLSSVAGLDRFMLRDISGNMGAGSDAYITRNNLRTELDLAFPDLSNLSNSLTNSAKSAIRGKIDAGTSDFDGAYGSLTGRPTIPTIRSEASANEAYAQSSTTRFYQSSSTGYNRVAAADKTYNRGRC